MTDDDSPGHNGQPPEPFGPPLSPSEFPPTAPVSGPAAPPTPPTPPVYPPGYAPSPGTEPSYQAPAPWAPAAFPPTAGYAPVGPPPDPPMAGLPGYANGALPEPPARRPRRRVVTVVVIALVVALVLAGAGTAVFVGGSNNTVTNSKTATSPAARQLLQSSLAAAHRVNAFHYVATSSLTGSQGFTQKTIGDAGPSSGRQDITVAGQKFTVLVIGKACYLKGNAAALSSNLGLSSASATAHAGQWISLAPSDGPYASVYAAVTAASALTDNITIKPQGQLPATRVDGRRVQIVSGAIAPITIGGQTEAPKGTATLAVRASSPHLPVRYTERGTEDHQKSRSTVTFTAGGRPSLSRPRPMPVTYASLGVGSGSVPTTPSGTVLT